MSKKNQTPNPRRISGITIQGEAQEKYDTPMFDGVNQFFYSNGKEFMLFGNYNFNLTNQTRNIPFNAGNLAYTFFNFGAISFPIGTKMRIKRVRGSWFNQVPAAQEVQLHLLFEGLPQLPTQFLSSTLLNTQDTGIINLDLDMVAFSTFSYQVRKTVLAGASGNMLGSYNMFCEWLVSPNEVL